LDDLRKVGFLFIEEIDRAYI